MEYFYECGRKRKGERSICEQCGKEFIRRITPMKPNQPQVFCGPECSHASRRNRVTTNCATCQKSFEMKSSSFDKARHGLHFCCRQCKDFAQSLQGNCTAIQPSHYGTGSGIHSYRERMKDRLAQGCETCGKKHLFLLEVHHKDGDRMHNDRSNLEVVCHNCHSIRHLKWSGTGWVSDRTALTPRDKIAAIFESLGT